MDGAQVPDQLLGLFALAFPQPADLDQVGHRGAAGACAGVVAHLNRVHPVNRGKSGDV